MVESLPALAALRLGGLLEQMLDRTDDLLFELAGRAANNVEVRLYFDTMRVLRLERAGLSTRFTDGVIAGFAPAAEKSAALPQEIGIDELTLLDARSVEQTIAIANMEAKAEGLYRQTLWDLQRRLEALAARVPTRLSPAALSPASICRAFQRATEALAVEFEVELIVYKLFDREVIVQLGPFYAEALALLDRHGVTTVAPRLRRTPTRPRPASAEANATVTGGAAPSTTAAAEWTLDAQTLALLRQLAGPAAVAAVDYGGGSYIGGSYDDASYSDAHLAADLANAAQGRPVPGWAAPQAQAYAQRAGLIGHMFNDLLDDPHLPEALKPQLDQLRFGVIKNALRDAAFFADPDHPVRRLVNELATIAATAKAGGDGVGRVGDLLDELRRQIDQAPAAVRTAAGKAGAVSDESAAEFVEQQRQQSRTRRKAIIARVREIVVAELRLRTAGLAVPTAAQPLLQGGWSTMMAYHLIRENRQGWADGIQLLQRLIQALDPERASARSPQERAELRTDLSEALLAVGLPGDRVEPMLDDFDGALATLDNAEANDADGLARTQPISPENALAQRLAVLLELLLVPGRWFHIFDPGRRERRWLKLVDTGTGGDEGSTFTEYNGKNPLTIGAQETVDGLLSRHLEPIDAPPAARQMLDALIVRREREQA